jgi:hypothetical protein
MLFKEWQPSIIEQIRSCNRSLSIIELGKGHLAVGIDERLLISPSHAFESPYVKGVLCSTVSRTFALEFPMRLFGLFGFLQGHHLRLGKDQALLQALSRQSLQPFF